ncbi:hypothetical protein WJX72_005062 [[Myrmecia] bisecta]|uniref:Hexosyltransferase n=1 Tax=[Myrmecia] bisecta TaxID=41462 RepID=A0AAW1PGC6_9CHLO
MPTDDKHKEIVRASRHWRQGIRTFIATNHEPAKELVQEGARFQEVWSSYPDDTPRRSYYEGDSRAALMPFLAHKHFGDTYKWLLYGDDDTIFFLDAVLKLVKGLDPNTPYFLTDHVWWSSAPGNGWTSSPHQESPRCTTCGFAEYHRLPMKLPQGCPHCTPQIICDSDQWDVFNKAPLPCTMPRLPERTYSMHGGAGAIISIGLLRNVSLETMERCVKSQFSTAGFGITDPEPFYHPEGLPMFDPVLPNEGFNEDFRGKINRLVKHLLQSQAGTCTGVCQLELDNTDGAHEDLIDKRLAGANDPPGLSKKTDTLSLLAEIDSFTADEIARRSTDRIIDHGDRLSRKVSDDGEPHSARSKHHSLVAFRKIV